MNRYRTIYKQNFEPAQLYYLNEVKEENQLNTDLTAIEDKTNLNMDVLTDINNQIEREKSYETQSGLA